ncbi:hypothetical protein [Microbispora catharanthi]|nr:hypothetical protein [Microbispora catharanthi]
MTNPLQQWRPQSLSVATLFAGTRPRKRCAQDGAVTVGLSAIESRMVVPV